MSDLRIIMCGLTVLLSATMLAAQEPPVEATSDAPERPKIRLRIDSSGMLVIDGPSAEVSNFNFVYEEILDKLKSLQTPLPDIRKYKCKHIDVMLAATILDSIYNGPSKAKARAATDKKKSSSRSSRDKKKEEEDDEPEERSMPPGFSGLSALFGGDSSAKSPTDLMGVQVVPDKRSGYLFIMAKSELFPMVIETLHTIDTEAVVERDYEIVVLTKLNADEVTAALEDLLGITEAKEQRKAMLSRRNRSSRNNRQNQQQNQLAGQIEDELVQIGGAEGFSVKDIRISALAATNSIIVFGPKEARESIVQIITKLDEQGNETRVMHLALVNADADSLAKTLQNAYGAKEDSDVVNVTADAASNTIFVAAPPSLREEIMIAIIQAESQARERKPRTIQVNLGDAKAIAEALKESFKDANKGKNKVTIAANSASNQILVSAPDDRFKEIEALVHELDRTGSPVVPKFYRLEHAFAPDVKDQVLEMAKQLAITSGDAKSVGPFGVTADQATNSLVVMGTQKAFLIMDLVIAEVDVPPKDPTRRTTRTIALYKNDAKEVAANINKLYKGKKTEGVDPPVADPNVSTNAVIVAGTLKQIGEIEEFIKSLEDIAAPEPGGDLDSYTIDLQFVDAEQAALMINKYFEQLFQARKDVGTKINDSEMTVTVTPDTLANRLFVNATENNKQKIDDIITAIDSLEAGGIKTRTTEIFRLKFADPGNVATIVNDRFKSRRGVAESEQVSAQVDMGTQSVVVTASGENMSIVQGILKELDVEGSQGRTTEVITLLNARVSDVAAVIGQRQNEIRRRTRQGQLPSSVVPNEATNSLLVTASPQDFQELKSLISQLDVIPSVMKDRFIKPYRIRYANLWSVRDSINQAFNSGRVKDEDRVNAGIDWDTGNLIVTASSERHKEIEEMLGDIDKESDNVRTVHVVKLNNGDAGQVGNNIQQMINQKRTQRGQTNPGVTADTATNSLFIYASDKEMDEFRPLIASMDVEDQMSGTPQRIALQHKNASEVADLLNKVFTEPAKQRRGGRGGDQRMVPTIVADDAGNALVVRAQELDYNEIVNMVADIDVADEEGASNIRIIQVAEGTDVGSLSKTIEDVIRKGEEFTAKANRNYKQRLVSVGYDVRTSTLLVSGSKSQFDQVENLVRDLEKINPSRKQNIRMINFKNIRAADVKKVLDQMLEDRNQTQRRGRR